MDFRVFSFFVWEIKRKEKDFGCEGVRKKMAPLETPDFSIYKPLFYFWLNWNESKAGKVWVYFVQSHEHRHGPFLFFPRWTSMQGGGACRTRKRQQTATHAVFSEKKKRGKIKSKIFAFRKEENTKMLTRRADFERQWTSNICMP